LSRIPPPPGSTLFPYTTLFRSHAGGGRDGGAGGGVHVRERPRVRAAGTGRGTGPQSVRAAPVLFLRRVHRLVRRSRQVPRGATSVGPSHEGAVSGQRRGLSAAIPHADRGLDADGTAARKQRGARGDPGAGGRVGGNAVLAYQCLRRGVGL